MVFTKNQAPGQIGIGAQFANLYPGPVAAFRAGGTAESRDSGAQSPHLTSGWGLSIYL